MKKLLLASWLFSVGMASPTQADFQSQPDHSFLWNRFNSVKVLGDYAVATTDFGLALLELDPLIGYFQPVNQLLLNTQPMDVKVAGDIAIVPSSAGLTYFVDLSALPELTLLGEIDLGTSVYDFVILGSDLYLACGFQGLRHYRLTDFSTPEFVDSSLAGVHCIQVDARGNELLVLDDYNGVLRYDLSTSGIDAVDNILYLPRRAQSFFLTGDTLVIPLMNYPLLYHGLLGPSGSTLIDSTYLITTPERVFVVDTFIVAVDTEHHLMEVISTEGGGQILINLHWSLELEPAGDTYLRFGQPHLLLVSGHHGLASYCLPDLWFQDEARQVYARPGPITALAFHQEKLATGGERNPLELYQIGQGGTPVFDTALYGLNNVGLVIDAGDAVLAHFPAVGLISAIQFGQDSILTLSSIPAPNQGIRDIDYFEYPLSDTLSIMLVIAPNFVDVIGISNNWQMTRAYTALTLDNILDAIVVDSFLLVTTTDRQLHSFRILNNLNMVLWWSVTTPGLINHMIETGDWEPEDGSWWHPGTILGFDYNEMYEIVLLADGFPYFQALATLPVKVSNTALGNKMLFTIGEQGVGRINLNSAAPLMDEYGGFGGHLIAFGDSTLATSDGTAIHLYSYKNATLTPLADDGSQPVAGRYLRPNYPNPFNPFTRIDFVVPQPMRVEISVFNLLGRRVVCLLEDQVAAGQHTVVWDGTDRYGRRAASGVYFYRLITPSISETRKMVLLK